MLNKCMLNVSYRENKDITIIIIIFIIIIIIIIIISVFGEHLMTVK